MLVRYVILSVLGFVLVGLLSALTVVAPAQASGGSMTVTTTADEYSDNPSACSLREAITAISNTQSFGGCNYTTGSDTILLAAGNTYELTIPGSGEGNNATGDLNILADMTIQTIGGGQATIQGEPGWSDRILMIGDTALTIIPTVTLSHVIIRGGNIVGLGGGIFINGGSTFANSSLSLNNVTVQDNVASNSGGGLANFGDLTVTATSILNNVSDSGGQAGGGVFNYGNATIVDSSILSNTASTGFGGGLVAAYQTTLKNVTISGNNARRGGGGIYFDPITFNTRFNNVTITNNAADVDDSNEAGADGGGIYLSQGALPPIFSNSIIAGNIDNSSTSAQHLDCSRETAGTPTNINSQGYNLFGDVISGTTTNCVFIGPQTGDILNTDPVLGPLQVSFGNMLTHEPLAGSPLLNGGNPAAPASGNYACEGTDQRGLVRPATQRCDIGAVEVGGLMRLFLPLVTR